MVLNLSDPDEMPVMIRSTRFALEFCRWLEESIEPRMRFRLPKLAEWRLAALDQIEKVNAAQSSADLSSLIQSANLTGVLTKTGSFQKSDNGFYDLIGNVAELCEPLHSLSLQNESVVAGGSCKTPSNELLDIEAIEPFDSMLPTGFRLAADASNDVNLSITNDCDKNIFVELRSLRMKRTTRVDEAFKSRHNNGTIPRVYPGWNLIRGKTEDGVMDDIETRYIPFVTTTDLRFTLVAGKLSISSDECPPLKPPVEE